MEHYLQYHLQKKEIKCIERSYLLTGDFLCTIQDYSVIGNDDHFYDRYGYDTLLHRGTCYIQSETTSKWLFGLPKFGYEDETTIPVGSEGSEIAVFTEKENGECGHVAMFDSEHIIIGSKNVHIVLSLHSYMEDLHHYEKRNEDRLLYAIKIARLLFDKEFIHKTAMLQYIYDSQKTLIIEAIFDNHIVFYGRHDYVATCLMKDRIVLSPLELQNFAQEYNIPIVSMNIVSNPDEYEKQKRSYTECERDSEGAVVYREVQTDIGMIWRLYKVKHPLYVVKRAARELIKRNATLLEWKQRMSKLHVEIPTEIVDHLLQFYLWIKTYHSTEHIQETFSKLYQEFSVATLPLLDPSILEPTVPTHVIGLCGIPGSGKTYLRELLMQHLSDKKIVYINQDELNGQRKKFIAALDQAVKNAPDILIVDKCNTTATMRMDIESRFSKIHWIVFEPPNDSSMVEVCLEQIRQRAYYHPTLVYNQRTREILEGFYKTYEPPTGDQCIYLQIGDTPQEWFQRLQSIFPNIQIEKTIFPRRQRPSHQILYWYIALPHGHITLCYKPTKEQNERMYHWFGKEIQVQTEGIYRSEQLQVAAEKVIIDDFLKEYCMNTHPHITIWTGPNAKPFDANRLFIDERETSEAPEDLHITNQMREYKGFITYELK